MPAGDDPGKLGQALPTHGGALAATAGSRDRAATAIKASGNDSCILTHFCGDPRGAPSRNGITEYARHPRPHPVASEQHCVCLGAGVQ